MALIELAGREAGNVVSTVVIVVVPFGVADEAGDVFAEAVVHHRVHLIAGQPLAGVGPDFADERTVAVVGLGVAAR